MTLRYGRFGIWAMGEKPDNEKSEKNVSEPVAADSQPDSGLGSEFFDHVRAAGGKAINPPAKIDYTRHWEVLDGKAPVDNDRPKVAVLDDYRYGSVALNDKKGFSHGELSARMAEENDLNVMRIQLEVKENGEYNMPKALSELDKAIEDGKVRLGNGDILNLSFANTETFEKMSSMLDMSITPENVKDKRDEILAAMKTKLASDGLSDFSKEWLKELVGINEGIQKLQERGIEVIAGGGNDGPNKFNFGFMMADKQYSALTSTGKQADYSAKNSLTEDGRGQVDIYFQKVDLFDPTSIEHQKGYYSIDGTNIKLPAAEFGDPIQKVPGFNLESQIRWNDLHSMKMQKTELASDNGGKPPFTILKAKDAPPDFSKWRRGTFVTTAEGTSFVNIFKLPAEYKTQAKD